MVIRGGYWRSGLKVGDYLVISHVRSPGVTRWLAGASAFRCCFAENMAIVICYFLRPHSKASCKFCMCLVPSRSFMH
jgi:hypothetical protein